MKLKSLFILLLGLSLIFTGCKTESNTEEEEFTVDIDILTANLVYMVMALNNGDDVTDRIVIDNKTLYKIHLYDIYHCTNTLSTIQITPYNIPEDINCLEYDVDQTMQSYTFTQDEESLWSEEQLFILARRLNRIFSVALYYKEHPIPVKNMMFTTSSGKNYLDFRFELNP